MKSNVSSPASASSASAVELTRVSDEVQVDILLVDLRFDVPVLFEDVAVVAATHEQDFVDAVFHEPVGDLAPVGHILFQAFVHSEC